MAPNVKYVKNGNVHSIELGVPGLERIVIDYSEIPVDQRVGLAKQLLAASALSCYVAALSGSLEARGASCEKIEAEAAISLGANSVGQGRVKAMDLSVDVNISADDMSIFERCARIMKNGCLVTGSLHDGINMEYKLNAVSNKD